jgi:hypothetical protein
MQGSHIARNHIDKSKWKAESVGPRYIAPAQGMRLSAEQN